MINPTEVVIYTTQTCPYCVEAKNILTRHQLKFKEVDVSDTDERAKMVEKAGGRKTVPQIFIGDNHIGGCDDLKQLAKAGKL